MNRLFYEYQFNSGGSMVFTVVTSRCTIENTDPLDYLAQNSGFKSLH